MLSGHQAHPNRSHRLRLLAVALVTAGFTLLALLVFLNARASGSPPDPNHGHTVTICHATGSSTNPFTSNTVDVVSSGLKGGHQNHDDDIIPPFTYVDNDDRVIQYPGKNMTTTLGTSTGASVLANGCIVPAPPVDACPNIDGNQATVPDGYVVDADGNCVQPPKPVDACPNIDGDQTVVPDGMIVDADGDCVKPSDPDAPRDLCSNIDGIQTTVPAGTVLEGGACITKPVEAVATPVEPAPSPSGGGDTPAPTEADGDTPAPTEADGDTPAPTEAEADAAPKPTGATIHRNRELPFTGLEENLLIALAIGFILVGLVLEFGHRRRHGNAE